MEPRGAAFGHGIAVQADQGGRLVGERDAVDAALLGVGGQIGQDDLIEAQ